LGVRPDDLQPADGRHPLGLPDALGEVFRSGGALVRTDEVDRRPRPGHDEAGLPAQPVDAEAAVTVECHEERLRDAVVAAGEDELAVSLLDRVAQRCGVIGLAVPLGPEMLHVGHAVVLPEGLKRVGRAVRFCGAELPGTSQKR
jgi:hypothetical protein